MPNKEETIAQVVDNLFYISPLVMKSLKQFLRTKANMNPMSFFILRILGRYDDLTMSEIGAKVQLPKPHLTLHVDKLIAENQAERVQDPTDRRLIRIKLTEKGKADLARVSHDINEDMRQRIHELSDEKIVQLLASTRQVRELLGEILK